MIVSCIPTSAFAGASTPRITEGIDASDPVTLISSIQDKEKREMIERLYTPIYVSYESGELNENIDEYDDINSTIDNIKRLRKLSLIELQIEMKKRISELIRESMSKKSIGYFTDEGVELVKEYCPTEINMIRTEQNFNIDYALGKLQYVGDAEEKAGSKPYDSTNTVGYTCAEGRAFALTVTIKWSVKNKKIVSRSSTSSTWTNGLWTRKSKKKTVDKIDSRGFGHIVWKARFQHKVGLPVIKHVNNGAWFYADGGCDWN